MTDKTPKTPKDSKPATPLKVQQVPPKKALPTDPYDLSISSGMDYIKRVTELTTVYPEISALDLSFLQGTSLTRDPEVQTLKQQILDLQNNVADQARELSKAKANKDAQLQTLQRNLADLRNKQKLDFLLSRVTPVAEKAILGTETLRQQFFTDQEQLAFVLSIDIRRSTELMLKARSPSLFAGFMTQLCAALDGAIKEEYGVFDKFTGDGVLAFFPEFFSGNDAGYHAITVAQRAISIFEDCYRRNRSSFTTILRDVNLAVGIDFGPVHLVQVAGGLTVVGEPVVYACRLSGGPPGAILLNQPAYEKISEAYGNLCLISETELEIKHEGHIICYSLKASNKTFTPVAPPWAARAVTDTVS